MFPELAGPLIAEKHYPARMKPTLGERRSAGCTCVHVANFEVEGLSYDFFLVVLVFVKTDEAQPCFVLCVAAPEDSHGLMILQCAAAEIVKEAFLVTGRALHGPVEECLSHSAAA